MDIRLPEPRHDAYGAATSAPPPRALFASLPPVSTPTEDDLQRIVRIGQLADELANMDDSYDDVPLFEGMGHRHP